MREIELANIKYSGVSFQKERGCGVATLKVAVSKTDWTAKGSERSHGCCCPSPLCPVAALRRLHDARLPGQHLVQTKVGTPVSKAALIRAMKSLATSLGHPRADRITGHTLRTTGAQRMASAGISEEKIRMFGRWRSDEMLAYVRETLISVENLSTARTLHDRNCAASSSVGQTGSSLAAAAPPRNQPRKWPSLRAAQT